MDRSGCCRGTLDNQTSTKITAFETDQDRGMNPFQVSARMINMCVKLSYSSLYILICVHNIYICIEITYSSSFGHHLISPKFPLSIVPGLPDTARPQLSAVSGQAMAIDHGLPEIL